MQAVQGRYYSELSETNRMRVVPIRAPRGLIYDRSGNLLINNVPGFNLYLVLEDMPSDQREAVIRQLAAYLGISFEEITRRIPQHYDLYAPIKIKEDLTFREVAMIEAHRLELPGVKIEPEVKRNAIYGTLAAHLLGYVGEIFSSQLESEAFPGLKQGEIVGQYGVEKSFDAQIRGVRGQKSIEVDALGHEVRVVKTVEPTPGNDLYLTLDLEVQKASEQALGPQAGAIVAVDPNNGELLAMASHPAFDPNLLLSRMSVSDWENLIKDPGHPLNNRVIQGQYPPGSTFKIVMAAAGLETKTVSLDDPVFCRGGMPFGNRVFRDWKRGGHGWVSLHRAVVESCDVYFYDLGNRLGIDTIASFSRLFGLGTPTGIDLSSEKSGLIPSTEWKAKTRGERWYPGETLSVSIGQSYVTVTPMQLASMVSAATTGLHYRPQILREIRESTTGRVEPSPASEGRSLSVSKRTLEAIRAALAGVVADPHGTGAAARSKLVSIGGKTGTAQVISDRPGLQKEDHQEDHAWFVSFAPVDKPKIVVVVLVEHGGHGGAAAAPLAKQVIEAYMNRTQPQTTAPQTADLGTAQGPT
jgi:penicillin-binding protein 2